MLLNIQHHTKYEYAVPANYALQQLRLRPVSDRHQDVLDWSIDLQGARHQTSFVDQHGNHVDLLELEPGATEVAITVSGRITTHDTNGVIGDHTLAMPLWFYLRQTKLTEPGDRVARLTEDFKPHARADVSILHQLSNRILEQVAYQSGNTDVQTTAEAALSQGNGVCQDHAHIFLSAARVLGFPARYVSGYLLLNDQIDQDASHAWAEAYVSGLGWVGFDVSNAVCPDERYVRIARGLDYRDAAPTTGYVVGAKQENLVVSLQVQQ
ncbi:MAG: transglutaminase family protein [Henriciella sp.]|nr:transglutaminase family protein [Henriciella sp.]